MTDADVAVIGFGPVGATLAILLGQLGRSVVVLERQPRPYPLPRAVHFDHEVGRILQSCGIGSEVRAITEPVDVYEWRNGRGETLLRFGRSGASSSGWPLSSMFNQPALERLLTARARDIPGVEVRRGVEMTGLTQTSDGVTVSTAGGEHLRAAYLVGCDGANSLVRELAGLPVCDLGFFYDWLVVDVTLDEPRVFDPPNLQVCDPLRPTTVVSGGPGRRRWEFMRLPHEAIDELGEEARAWELLASWDVHPGNARLERHAVYTFRARHAERWRDGRVLVAGDAAHLMPPFAGQGMCAGIRDAANLAWKLDFVLSGHASDALLDTYEQERLPHARAAIDFSIELGKVICVPDPEEAAARDAAMSAAVGAEPATPPPLPGITAGIVDGSSEGAGELLAQPRVDGRLFDDVHGVGWRLITLGPSVPGLDSDTGTWFESIGGRCVALHPCDELRARSRGGTVTHLLQRPDFHLYGSASDRPGASELLRGLRTRLQGQRRQVERVSS